MLKCSDFRQSADSGVCDYVEPPELGKGNLEAGKQNTSDNKKRSNVASITTAAASGSLDVESLMTKYHRLLMHYIRQRVYNYSEAEDIAQEVYCRVSKADLREVVYPKAFLMRTARNYIIDVSRREGNLDLSFDTDVIESQFECYRDEPERQALSADMMNTLESALAELSPKCQVVFVKNRVDGISLRQIAVQLKLSRSMVEKYMRQSLIHLKAALEVHYE